MIKTYDKYKQSDDIWLGNIPEHWTISSLKHFVEIISGYAFKSEDYSDDEGVPICLLYTSMEDLKEILKRVSLMRQLKAQ